VWRDAVVQSADEAIENLKEITNEFQKKPKWLAGINSRESKLPISFSANDIAYAFSWRANAKLAIIPAEIAMLMKKYTNWDLVELSGVPDLDILEICETLWDTNSSEFSQLSDALAAANKI